MCTLSRGGGAALQARTGKAAAGKAAAGVADVSSQRSSSGSISSRITLRDTPSTPSAGADDICDLVRCAAARAALAAGSKPQRCCGALAAPCAVRTRHKCGGKVERRGGLVSREYSGQMPRVRL